MTVALDLVSRVVPILVFLVALTALAELADESGVFEVASHGVMRVARGRTAVLLLLLVALVTMVTITLSLDTTAVLLTPAVIAVARKAGLPTLPLALLVLWLANTASLLLPVSNLTNLLAWQTLESQESALGYVSLSWVPAVVAVLATLAVFWTFYGRHLPRSFTASVRPQMADPVCFTVATAACLLLGPLVVLGLPAWLAATALTLPVLAIVGWRRRHVFRRPMIPWRALVTVTGLFVLLGLVQETPLGAALAQLARHPDSLMGNLQTAGVGAILANGINNLPAFLALEAGAAHSATALMALLIGVNCGPLVTVWGSLATVLWLDRCRVAGLPVPLRRLSWQGGVVAALSVVTATVALSVTR